MQQQQQQHENSFQNLYRVSSILLAMLCFCAVTLSFAIFTHLHPTKSNRTLSTSSTKLHHFNEFTCGGGAANSKEGSPQMARTSAANSSSSAPGHGKHPAGLGSKNSVVGHEVCFLCVFLQFQGEWEGFNKKRHLSWMRRFVHTPAYQKIQLTNGPLDYQQLSCQDSIWLCTIIQSNYTIV